MDKVCFKCSKLKPLSEYYKHPAMGDGHLGKCKECAKNDVKLNTEKLLQNPEWVEKELDRQRIKQRKKNPFIKLTKEDKKKATDKYRERHPEKYIAKSMVNNAVRDGRLEKLPCSVCGNLKSEAHHEDYSKPLDIIWYCKQHHADRHVEIRRLERATKFKNPETPNQ